MKRASAFPDGFGADSAMMAGGSRGPAFAGGEKPEALGNADDKVALSIAPMVPEPQVAGPVSVRLDPGGFHLNSDPASAATDDEEPVSRRVSILVPLAVVGVCLALAAYFVGF